MPRDREKQVVRDFISACDGAARGCGTGNGNGNGADPYAFLDENVDVTVHGRTPLSGRFQNRYLVRHVLADTAAERFAKASVSIAKMIGEGSRVAALLVISGESRDGRAYNPKGEMCGCLFGLEAGKITEILLWADTSMIEMALYNRRYVEA